MPSRRCCRSRMLLEAVVALAFVVTNATSGVDDDRTVGAIRRGSRRVLADPRDSSNLIFATSSNAGVHCGKVGDVAGEHHQTSVAPITAGWSRPPQLRVMKWGRPPLPIGSHARERVTDARATRRVTDIDRALSELSPISISSTPRRRLLRATRRRDRPETEYATTSRSNGPADLEVG